MVRGVDERGYKPFGVQLAGQKAMYGVFDVVDANRLIAVQINAFGFRSPADAQGVYPGTVNTAPHDLVERYRRIISALFDQMLDRPPEDRPFPFRKNIEREQLVAGVRFKENWFGQG